MLNTQLMFTFNPTLRKDHTSLFALVIFDLLCQGVDEGFKGEDRRNFVTVANA